MASRFIVGLDIGTASVKAVVAERTKDGAPFIRCVARESVRGVRKGVIVDLAEASHAVASVLGEVKKISRTALNGIFTSVGTHHIKAQVSRGIGAVSRVDAEIYQDDVDRVLRASQAVNVAPNRMVIHNVTREFIVDGVGDINDPMGLSGSRLEVNSLVIDVFAPHVKNMARVIELCGGQIQEMVLSPLTAARAVISRTQRDLGTVLIDIGGGTTGVAVYEENKLLGVSVFPVGASNVTNDIAVGFRVPVEIAEAMKLEYGYAVAKDVSARETISIEKHMSGAGGEASRRLLAEVIECRLVEILGFVNNELKLLGKVKQLPGGAVLVGGGAKLPGFPELVKRELKISSQIGTAIMEEWAAESGENEVFEDPEFAGALGLVLWGADQEEWKPKEFGHRASRLTSLLKYFLP